MREQPAIKQSEAYMDNKAESKEKNKKIYFKIELMRFKAVKEKLKREWINLDRVSIVNIHARFWRAFIVEKNQERI